MKIEFVAGFGPIARSGPESLAFWSGAVRVPFEEVAPGYFATDDLPGTKAFAVWPLEQAAESTFGTTTPQRTRSHGNRQDQQPSQVHARSSRDAGEAEARQSQSGECIPLVSPTASTAL